MMSASATIPVASLAAGGSSANGRLIICVIAPGESLWASNSYLEQARRPKAKSQSRAIETRFWAIASKFLRRQSKRTVEHSNGGGRLPQYPVPWTIDNLKQWASTFSGTCWQR